MAEYKSIKVVDVDVNKFIPCCTSMFPINFLDMGGKIEIQELLP